VISLIRAILERALSQIAGGTMLPTEDDDRMTCHDNQEQSRCSSLVSYAHKKLLSGRGCILVGSISLSRIFYLQ